MNLTVDITESKIFQTLGDFLTSILPSSCAILQGQQNRIAEPPGADFIIMTPILRKRLSTNVNNYVDVAFFGSISGNVLTVTEMVIGTIEASQTISGYGVLAGTQILSQNAGGTPGGVGTYNLNLSQIVVVTVIQAGTSSIYMGTEITIQLDVHGPNSGNNSQIIATLMRDAVATDFFTQENLGVSPLYTDDARQMPFINAEQQFEERYVIDTVLYATPNVTIQQQFADMLTIGVISVDEAYPPA